MQTDIQQYIVNWLHQQPDWLQSAAEKLLVDGAVTEADIQALVDQLKTPEGQKATTHRTFPEIGGTQASADALRLLGIGDISGIEALGPRRPVEFRTGNLTVVYGHNGSGKSGYTRILKRVSGKPRAPEIKANVFHGPPSSRQCRITFAVGDQEQAIDWSPDDDPIAALRPTDIFDTDVAAHYLSRETKASYTPPAVALFKELASMCDRVNARLQEEQTELVSTLPALPLEYRETLAGKTFAALRPNLSDAELSGLTTWTEDDEQSLSRLVTRLSTADPAAQARKTRRTKTELDHLIRRLRESATAVGSECIREQRRLRAEAENKRRIAAETAQIQTGAAELAGIGTDTWNAMWEAARSYSAVAYPNGGYPVTVDGARCVLCQQDLSPDAQQRLQAFEAFVQGTVESEAKQAEEAYKTILANLPIPPTAEAIRTQCEAAGLVDDSLQEEIREFWRKVGETSACLGGGERGREAAPVDLPAEFLRTLEQRSNELESEASQNDKDAEDFNREEATRSKLDLEARRWTAQQAAAIHAEIERRKSFARYDELKLLANSRPISIQAGEVSERVITAAYVARFNDELRKLGADHLRVELVKIRTDKGTPLHQIRLKGAPAVSHAPDTVLSEGERRIVSLAAFLADVVAQPHPAPFVFDDPISSLDQEYEWRVATRLAELAQDRQVVVFTHRLSLYGAMEDAAKRLGDEWKGSNLEQLCIESFGGTVGHPADEAAWIANTKKANNILLDRLTKARQAGEQDGADAYRSLAQAICSDFRKLLERTVEDDLLNQVVRRHRRGIQTDNRLAKLHRISPADCEFIDGLMTKYSCYEHSQSAETPVFLPEEPELRADLQSLKDWREEFQNRAVQNE